VITGVLRAAWRDPAIRDEYIAQLAVAGDDGTLEHRIDVAGADRWVRAKTGTLDDAIALSGYVLSREPGRTYVFSVLANGVRGNQSEARRLADRIARELVAEQMR
jgi:D-alanyl-D-alanine carboxypeptidase/D-alanyl-D-alanine-endopeptidase (penicillin-binding protein 4)